MKYLLAYYREQEAGSFHALVQGNMTVEEYEARFMELVKYVPYLDSDDRQVERFVYGLNYKIRATVRMLKSSSVSMAVEYAHYAQNMSYAKGGSKLIGSNKYVTGKAP